MTLEDFFTLTGMKDGLTVPVHVQELITVMHKEKDSLLKSIGDATRQWAAVASTIAATENKECLDLFIQLDGLLFLDRWLKDAQAFPDESSDCFLEEAISALLQAVEKLQVDSEKLTSSGICMTVKSLLNYKNIRIRDKAKALIDSWKAKNDECADIVTSPVKLDSIADDSMGEEICSSDQTLDSECIAASKQSSDAVTSESLEPEPLVEDAKNDNLAVMLPWANRFDKLEVTSSSATSVSKGLLSRTDAKVAEEAVVKPSNEACAVKVESPMKTATACETVNPLGESSNVMDDNYQKGLEIGDASALEGSKDQGAATLTLENDECSVLKRYQKSEIRILGSRCEFGRSKYNRKANDIICQIQDMDLEDGTVDALDVARRVAKEVESEVGYYEQSCSSAAHSSSSSSDRISRDDVTQHDSLKSINKGQDLGINGPAVKQAAEIDRASTPGQAHTFSDIDLKLRQPKACESDFRAVNFQLDSSLARNTKSQIPDIFCTLGSFRKDLNVNDAADVDIARIVSFEPDDAKEPPPKSVVESSSILQMVESLKAELEKLKKEHAELNEIDAKSDFASRNRHFGLVKSKHDNGGRLAKRDKNRQILKEVTLDKDDVNDLRMKARGLKREQGVRKLSSDVEKRPKIAVDVDETKEGATSALNQDKSSPEGIFSAYVSTSESSARVMMSEDELESSSQQVGKLAKVDGATLIAAMEGVEGKCVDTSEFSIRDFVFTARNKDISMNWPFSQKNLQLCLQHGVKDVLPPFHPMDSLRESSMRRCLDEKSLHSEESTLGEKVLMLKNHHVPGTMRPLDHSWDQELAEGYRDSVSLPIGGERDLAFKSIATANSHSEVESVSTSNLPLSEVSDDREAAASTVNKKTKCPASQLSNKKNKAATKMRINSKRNTPEDIAFACTVPSEAISSKVCPVCENFSSSSNTTLNAHIDQCLSSQSPPNWVKSSKLVKPRIKPRKMRLMSDICATALCCTLEDLDRRNGTNWATNVDSPLEEADGPAEQENPGVSSRYIINEVDDGSVYIDSSGRKIRILSKLNDTPSSFSKTRKDIRPKKQSRKGERSKFLSSNRKKRLTKHLKYLKLTHQRKRLSSSKTKARSIEVCGAEETMLAVRKCHMEQHQTTSYVKDRKTYKPNHLGVEGTASQLIPLKNSISLHKDDLEVNVKLSRNDNQAEKNSFIGNDQDGSAQVEPGGTSVKMHLNLPKRSLSSIQSNFRAAAVSPAETDQSGGSCRGNMDGPSLRRAVRGNRVVCQASLKSGTRGSTKESTPKCSDSVTVSVPAETEVDRQPDALQNSNNSLPCSQKLLHSSHAGPPKGMRSLSSNSNIFLPIRSRVHACQVNSDRIDSALETLCDRNGDKETDVWSVDASQQSGSRINRPNRNRIADSLRSSSTIKVPQKQVLKHGQDGSKVTNRSDELADDHCGNHGCVRSLVNGHHNGRDFIASVSPSSLVIGVNETKLRSDLDPEVDYVADVSSQITSLQHGPLSRAKTRGQLSDSDLNHEHEMFCRNAVDDERSELKTGDVILNFGPGSFFSEVDPIPIPGPPGSDLPCFSDMGSDDQFRSSLSSCLAQPSWYGDNVVNRDLSHSQSFAASSISNFCRNREDDPTANEQESLSDSLLVPDNVYSWWLGACSGPFSTVPSQFTAVDIERVTCVSSSEKGLMSGGSDMLNCDDQQCCSEKEEITPSSINSEETQLLGLKQTSSRSEHGYAGLGGQVNGLNGRPAMFSSSSYLNSETSHQSFTSLEATVQAAVPFLRTGEYDSSIPSAPILRLMGKDLMVSNRVDTDLSRSQAAMDVSMNKLGKQSWEQQPSQNPAYMKPVLHEQDPHYLSVRHFDSGSSNVIHNFGSNHQASGGFYNYDCMNASFSVLGAMPSQR